MKKPIKRCEARTRKGMCDLPLDKHGYCGRASDHIEEPFSFTPTRHHASATDFCTIVGCEVCQP